MAAPSDIASPLPAPMVEPVQPPAPAPDSQPLPPKPALSVPFADSAIVVAAASRTGTSTPLPDALRTDGAAETVCDRPAGGSPSRVVGGSHSPTTHPGLSDSKMNEAEVPPVAPATVPATDRADQPPAPAPPPNLRAKLVVLRGAKISVEYPIYEGRNTVGRFADKPVDIDLFNQETPEQIWCSRQHATLTFDRGNVMIEDLNSLNGTWVNGVRIHAGQPRQLRPGDVVQIGTVQMKLVVG
jgi:hypothetical protein